MSRRSVGGYLRRHWPAIVLGVLVVFSEALILTQFPIDRTDISKSSQDSSEGQKASRKIPPLSASWVPIRNRLLRALDVNLSFIDRYHDDLNAISTLAVAIFTATLWGTTKRLWNAGEKQIILTREGIISNQRAWIKVTASPGDSLIWNEQSILYSISISFTNTGNIPAEGITWDAWLIAGKRTPDGGFVTPIPDHRDRCIESRSRAVAALGEFLFPGESYPKSRNISVASFGCRIDTKDLKDFVLDIDGRKTAILFVGSSVNYRFATSDRVHQTSFLYAVGDGIFSNSFVEGQIETSADKLALGAVPDGDARRAD